VADTGSTDPPTLTALACARVGTVWCMTAPTRSCGSSGPVSDWSNTMSLVRHSSHARLSAASASAPSLNLTSVEGWRACITTSDSGSGIDWSYSRGDLAVVLRTYPFVVRVSGPSYGMRPDKSS
jgi:hypothetical protein